MKIILLILASLLFTLNAQTLEKVKLQLKWKTQFEFAGFIAAKEKGFFKEEGLDVELLEYTPNTKTLLDLEEGKTLFALSDSSVILEAAKGKKLVALMAIYQNSPYVLMSLKSSNIKTLSDINNKKIAFYTDMNAISIVSMLNMQSIDFEIVPYSDTFPQLQQGEADLTVAYISNEPYSAKEMGIEVNTINLNDYGFNRYGDILFTLEDTVKNRPELVAKMYRATQKGFKYAFTHIDEMAGLIYEKYNTQKKSKKAYIYEANTLKGLLGEEGEFGKLDPAKVDSIGYIYAYSGSIKYDKENLKNFIYKYDADEELKFTAEELLYLKNKKSITMCYDTSFFPYTMIENGQPVGVSVDYLKLVEKKINKKFKFIYSDTIKKQFTMAYEKKCSTVPLMQREPNNLTYLNPTISAGKDNLVLVTKIDEPYVFNMEKLKNKKIGVNRAYTHLTDYLDKHHPYINYIKIDDDGLEKVVNGELFGCIGTSIIMNYKLSQKFKDSLKVMTAYSNSYIEGGIGVSTDEPILLSILNKAMATIDTVKQDDVFKKWINVKYEKIIDYSLIYRIVALAIFFLSVFIYWNIKLRKEIKKRKEIESDLQEVELDLKELNSSLEEKVKLEISKNEKHQLVMMQQNKLVQMGEMIENIAHQWRQPLAQVNSAVLMIDAMLHKNNFKNDKVDEKLLEIESLTKYMSKTIDDFKEFFNQDKQKKEFDFNDLVESSLKILKGSLNENYIKVDIDINTENKCLGYLNELQQVIVVILNNAKDALVSRKTTSPKIKINVKEISEYFSITICDNAGGIKKENIDKVFEPYFTTKHKTQGTGLGLYISKMIIEEGLGGKLMIENNDYGACFEIIIYKEEL